MSADKLQGSPGVLIVDDDDDIRHALRLMFELEDFEVLGEASNGLEAVALARKLQPDFVVLDYLMPRLDGAGAAELVRSVCPGARIVAFSAALRDKPEWSDAYLNKERISEIVPLISALVPWGATA